MRYSLICFFAVLIFSCTAPTADTEKIKQEIISADKAMSDLAAKEGFNAALLEYADENFVKFSEGSLPVIGRSDFAKKAADKPGSKNISWEPLSAEVAQSGELGYTWGNWKFTMPDTTLYGNYFTAWKKQADGKWKILLDGGNATPAPKR